MIKIVKHIEEVELTFGSEKIISTLPHIHSSEESIRAEVPIDISFNERWTVSHKSCDGHSVSFSESGNHNWNFINRLFSRFYEKELLETIADGFDSLKVLETDKSKFAFLTREDFNDPNANLFNIPQVKFNHYTCKESGCVFLCRFVQGEPISPDPRYPEGKEGLLRLFEIVQIEIEDGLTFEELLNKYAKEVN